jgi:hypothetical protein
MVSVGLRNTTSKQSLLETFPEGLISLNKEILENKIPALLSSRGSRGNGTLLSSRGHGTKSTPRLMSFGSTPLVDHSR